MTRSLMRERGNSTCNAVTSDSRSDGTLLLLLWRELEEWLLVSQRTMRDYRQDTPGDLIPEHTGAVSEQVAEEHTTQASGVPVGPGG